MWMGVVAVVVLALVIWMASRSANDEAPLADGEGTDISDMTSTEDTTAGSVNTSAPQSATLSYQQALVKYADARIQIDSTCQVSPNNVTYKNGTNIMLDNRSAVTRTIKLGSTYTIKPYGFKIVRLSSSTLPSTLLMDCDSSQNVATVLIQK